MTNNSFGFTLGAETPNEYFEKLKARGINFDVFPTGSYSVDLDQNYIVYWDDKIKNYDEFLGCAFDLNGQKLFDIPAYVLPSYKDMKKHYRSQIAWTQHHGRNWIDLVVRCWSPQDFRIRFDFETLQYGSPSFQVR